MPSSTVRTFTDPDEYTASIRATRADLTVTGRGLFAAKLTQINLHKLWIQRFADNLPRVAHATDDPGNATIAFRTHPGPSLRSSGVELLQSNIIQRSEAEDFFQKSDGFAFSGSISLPIETISSVGAAVVGCDLTPPKDARSLTPPAAAMSKLLDLHAAAGQLAEDAPARVVVPEAARCLEQALIGAMINCFATGEVDEDRSALRQHALIMQRFCRQIDEHPDEALYIPELCAAIGVSERTLRVCCHEHLGVGPKRYLLLRRMHLAWRALREGAPTATTVTEIATRYGFWQFGRFAGEYKAVFGEAPSIMLARPSEATFRRQVGTSA